MKRLFSLLDKQLSVPYRHAPVLGRGDYAQDASIKLYHFGAVESIDYHSPKHLQPLPNEFASMLGRVDYPQPFVLEIAKGQLHGRHALATTEKGEVILESLLNHQPYLQTISAGRIHYPKNIEQLWAQMTQTAQYKKVFALVNQFGNAYFHWMLETLPRLWLYRQLGDDMPILIEANPPRHVQETLELLGIKDVLEWKSTAGQAEKLFIPMALHGTGIPSPNALRWLRGELFANAKLPLMDAPYIYVSRQKSKKRRVVNEAEIVKFLEGRGFQVFFLEELSLVQQMALFKQAKIVLGAHGAGFSNVLFSENVKLLEFFEPSYLNACYYRLASGMGFDYGLLMGESVGLDMRVDLTLLEQLLDAFA